MNRIYLRKVASGWVAQYVGPHVASIIELFGTDTIPTPFTSAARALDVQAEIATRNPDVQVLIA